MRYGKVICGTFIARPNRFVAAVSVDGRTADVHVKNTGRCRELLVDGARVYLEDHSANIGKRKLAYDLIAVEKGGLLINMDSQAPNKAVKEALESGNIALPDMGRLKVIRPETVYGGSRFDFYLEDEKGGKGYLEVKGVTLENSGIASFPDAPTERGIKHVTELVTAHEDGFHAYVLFVVQMEGMKYVTPNDERHKAFGDALRYAAEKGVHVLAYECRVKPDSMEITKEIPVSLSSAL